MAVSTVLLPEQIDGGNALTLTVGDELTVMATVAGVVLLHPAAVVPTTVYVVFTVGLAVVVSYVVVVKVAAGVHV